MYRELLLEIDDPVATITLNRPEKLNALTDTTLQELKHALATAERSDAVVGIVITGAGRGFCAGVDMGSLNAIQQAGTIDAMRTDTGLEPLEPGDPLMGPDFARGFAYILTVRKPVIAAVNGPTAGLGFSLAMFCDLRFIAEGAALVTAYAQRGLVAEHGMSWVLPHLVGPSRALDVLWSGRRVPAEEALALGLVNRVVPAERLLDEARDYIRTLAASAAPASLMRMKQQVYRHLMQPLGDAMRETDQLVNESIVRPEFKEGIAAFVERRAPRFARLEV